MIRLPVSLRTLLFALIATIFAPLAALRRLAGRARLEAELREAIARAAAQEQRLAEYSARLATLSRRVLTVQEEERRAVARELHDELGQVLTTVKLNIEALRRRSQAGGVDAGDVDAAFDDCLALLYGAIGEVRALSARLRPTALDDLGLEAALLAHLDRSRVRAELTLVTELSLPQRRLDPAVETACFRIVQEAVTNVLRHGRATRLVVGLGVEADHLVLSLRDDGRGFDLAAVRRCAAHGDSAGISGMEERARLAGGRLEIHTAPGRGTEVRALFPLAAALAGTATPVDRQTAHPHEELGIT